MSDFGADWLYTASTWVLPVLFAVAFHEVAHGYAAWTLGDPTAKMLGRLSLNPIRHVDPIGTVALPGVLLLVGAPFLFGWAKPVPVNFRNLRNGRRDVALVALAGPGGNLAMAVIAALAIHGALEVPWQEAMQWTVRTLLNAVRINLLLAVFNMIPLPPLDGGRVLVSVLPPPAARKVSRIERYGMLIVVGLVFLPPMIGERIGVDLNVFAWIVAAPVGWLSDSLLMAVGLR